jgi:TolB-like protein/class 3 adenylate cyclase/Flp pilus assembly protein TadD
MAAGQGERRLAAVLAADVAGYSRLMGADEDGTLARLTAHRRELFDPTIAKYRGRIVKTTGDGLLAEFASVIDAVRCAVEVQAGMAERNLGAPESRRLDFRMGINVGDIVDQDNDIFGDGVNIAARLEGIAEPGGVCVSQRVQEDAAGKTGIDFEDMGEQALKNIARPIRAYRVRVAGMAPKPDASAAALPPLPDKPSIAVLPFQNMSGDPEQEYFADGISEDLITALSKLRGFFVIARNSTFAYKGKTPDVRAVARELGVRYVLEGSVRKAGERLRVTAQLIDASTGTHIWAERYDRPVADIFAVQDEISASIVATIEGKLYDAENLRVKTRPTESLDAWGCVVRAWSFASNVADPDGETRLSLLRRAVELDPRYALAHALIAWVHAGRAHYGTGDYDSEIAMALKSARRAITLDPDDPWGHHALGYAYTMSRRTDQAIEELKAALARNPNFARSEMMLGAALANAGRVDEAMHHLAIATRLSPRDIGEAPILFIYGICHFLAGRYSESVAYERRAVELRPEYVAALNTLAAAAGLAGDIATAQHSLAEAKRIQPSLTVDWIDRYHPLVRPEDRARYVDGLRKAGLS